ncbi:hypothetical protein NQ314_005360 [Rhamnusium bicolor]|uniref:LRRCT domain-containing protein n=1 Tax=Rhamnusium bicolor TaxID=1586634 RepID=A0AAV8ZK13_9CUCU|nr:hypothetical protein NQ314_005360 [Rhamnusium bicolor]
MLNLSFNQLPDLEETGLRSLRSLEMLDVSNNRISKVVGSSLEKMEWLVELRIDNNNICGVQGSAFNGMPRLRVLSLKNNKLMSFPEHAVQRLRGNIAILDIDGNPLTCSCNILWLQAWLQESSQTGPHCIDGTLLREKSLSRQDCSEQAEEAELVAPGCEAELLAAPDVYSTSQVFSHQWMNLKTFKNITKHVLGDKNNLAPSPEESDYFYDEYVDYPYNESFVDIHNFPNDSRKDKEVTETATVKIPLTTKSSHYTPGNTPTIYAATKNQSRKPDIPAKVSNSPSTSGFTFFGVPLSNLNLNNLLGGGTGRLESNSVAERKNAILNNPTRSTDRGNMGNTPYNLPLKMHPHFIGNMQPPSLPEIQTGFVPILPGYGGFKPIPNPNLPVKTPYITSITNVPPTESPDVTNVRTTSLHQIVNVPTVNENINRQFSAIVPKQQNSPPDLRNENIGSPTSLIRETNLSPQSITKVKSEVHGLPNPVNITTKPMDIEKGENLQTRIQVKSENRKENTTDNLIETISVFIQEITTENIDQTTLIPEFESFPNTEKIDSILTESSDDIPIITTDVADTGITISPKLLIGSAEVVPQNVTSNMIENAQVNPKKEDISNARAPLSALLIPEVHQPQFKHGGRSTIIKVPSPHIAANAPLQSNLELSQDSLTHREGKNTHDYKFIPTTEETSDDDINWYFANYNKSSLEPYVARITNTNRAVRELERHQFLYLMLFTFYAKIIFTLL